MRRIRANTQLPHFFFPLSLRAVQPLRPYSRSVLSTAFSMIAHAHQLLRL